MHDCQKFREQCAGLIDKLPEALPECSSCRQYASEAAALFAHLESLRSEVPDLPAEYWTGFNSRLRQNLIDDAAACTQMSNSWGGTFGIVVAVAAALVIAVSTVAWRGTQSVTEGHISTATITRPVEQPSEIRVVDEHLDGLDEGVIKFMGQGEMFLRSFTKITPSNIEDIEDARSRAAQQLAGIEDRREAAMDFVPVQILMDEYETVLLDIKQLEPNGSLGADIADIQGKIRQNGLIAGMKTFQPRVELVLDRGR